MTEKERRFIGRLYSENAEKLFIYAFSCVNDRHIAEDLVIETFVSASKKASGLISHPNPGGWIREALKLEIKMHLRTMARTPQIVPYDTVTEHYTPKVTDHDDQGEILLSKSGLTKPEQEECRMFFLENLTHSQVAEKLGITVSASQKRRERLRKKLKRRWEKLF